MPINYKEYPTDWADIRQRILDRDQHRCTNCGVANYVVGERQKDGTLIPLLKGRDCSEAREFRKQMMQITGKKVTLIILTVAHLDHDEWNHDVKDERLAAMCQKCHLDYDRIDNQMRKKYGRKYRQGMMPIFSPEQLTT